MKHIPVEYLACPEPGGELSASGVGNPENTAGDSRRSAGSDLLIAVGLALLAGAAYLPALAVGFFSDDFYFLGRNAAVMEHPLYVFHIFYRDFIPMVHSSFAVDFLLGGEQSFVYHFSSILFHVLSTGLVFYFCRGLAAGRATAAAATLLWALNVHISEPVIWVAARGHSLATLFLVACFVAMLKRPRIPLAVALFLLALGAKETALFPVVLVPLLHGDRRRMWRSAAVFAPIAVAFVLFNLLAKPQLHLARGTPLDFLLQAPFLLLRPLGLDRYYDFSALHAIAVYGGFALLAFLLRKQRVGLIGLAWVALSLVPVALQPVYTSRYFYMPTVGFALVFCAFVQMARHRLESPAARRSSALAATALLLLMLAADVVFIQREIGDYRMLSEPYAKLVATMRPEIEQLQAGETLVVLDSGPRSTVAELNDKLEERGNLLKLNPLRPERLDGIINLQDLVNFIKGHQDGLLAREVLPAEVANPRCVLFDGREAHPLPEIPRHQLPPERVLFVSWGPSGSFFRSSP